MWAHPRSRGENASQVPPLLRDGGSSPLTRGKLRAPQLRAADPRLIPAHAGKTRTDSRCCSARRAHPRSRGENDTGFTAEQVAEGSSPLTRGKLLSCSDGSQSARLIPAHAGKTGRGHTPTARAGAHPRSRGENGLGLRTTRNTLGSSPLTRGKHPTPPRRVGERGLIPAHAGKTRGLRQSTDGAWAHPRSRGENYGVEIELAPGYGSSPLTRGKRPGLGLVLRRPGLIPAHAGKTPYVATVSRAPSGSSPLTRGKRSCGTHR